MSEPVNEGLVQEAITLALRAPSAHNAQPWRLSPDGDGSFLLWYAFADRLLADPDDRDGIMAVGGFYETLSLAAQTLGLQAALEFGAVPRAAGLRLGQVTFGPLPGPPDALATAVTSRQCNRNSYSKSPLPPGLRADLTNLGHILLPPALIAPLVARASMMAWRDERFVTDLAEWTRFDDISPDGMTVDCLRLSTIDQGALRFALSRGSLPAPLARVYAQRDVALTRASATMAILVAEGRDPAALFDCGRRLVRSWTLINSLGYAWHPMSIVIDQPTVSALAEMMGGRDAVAIYRVGYTGEAAAWSKRRSVDHVLVPPPV